MRRILKQWKRRACRQNGGEMSEWDEMAEYLKSWVVILTLAVLAAIQAIVIAIVSVVIWVVKNAQWLVLTLIGIGIVAVWFWRSCTEKFG